MVRAGNFTLTPCSSCGNTSEIDEGMVACDNCDMWFHYRCVRETEESLQHQEKWFCPSETCKKTGEEYLKKADDASKGAKPKKLPVPDEQSDKSSTKSDRQPISTLDKKLKALEKEQKTKEKEIEMERVLREKRMQMDRTLKEKQLQMENELRDKEMLQEKELLEKALRDQQAHADRMQKMRDTYKNAMIDVASNADARHQNKKAQNEPNVDKSMSALEKENTTTPLRNPRVTVHNVSEKRQTAGVRKRREIAESESSEDEYGSTGESSDDDSDDEEVESVNSTPDSESDEELKSSEESSKLRKKKLASNGLGLNPTRPTKAQLSARSGITKKLPIFTGKPEEWPLFIGSYEASTKACGFNDVENLVRLQESLKGSALESVRGQLLLPKSVPKVISKLRLLYGRPEQLLHCHLEKVKRLESPKAEKLETFIPFGNAVEQLCDHLEAAGLNQHLINPLLIQDLVDKLPARDKREWVRFRNKRKIQTLRTFSDFLAKIVLEACEANVAVEYVPASSNKYRGARKERSKERGAVFNHSYAENPTNNQISSAKPCKVCKRTDHRLRFCQDFKALAFADRMKIVERCKLCKICLNEHGNAPCKFKIKCNVGECRQRHHPLLHSANNEVVINTHIRSPGSILFRIIPVTLHCGEKSVKTLAFLDEGASITLVERSITDQLGAEGVKQPLTIKWTADVTRTEPDSRKLNLWTSAPGMNGKILLKSVQTVAKLLLPKQALNVDEVTTKYNHLCDLPIASYTDSHPGLLIGLNNLHAIAPIEARIRDVGEPIAVRSKLGWSVYGPLPNGTSSENTIGHHGEVSNEDIYNLLKTQYRLEEPMAAVIQETKDEKRAREILQRTTVRIGDRFETGLLWRTNDPVFPDSLPMARRRLRQLEQRLVKCPELYEKFRQQIDGYLQKGYAHLATSKELAETDHRKRWYLPLNAVVKPKKPGSIRLVWDAAATVNGVSLNSQLLKGPDMLTPLTSVISLFRERRIAFGADIREMYHQLKIREADKQSQRFLFRKNPQDEPSVYIMDVATFGSTSSPCSAQYVKNLNASEFSAEYPEAASAIINKHYVDDYFDSVDTIEDAVRRAKEVKYIHSKAGFEIRNWVSNSAEVLRSLGENDQAPAIHFNVDKSTENERVLGIIWNPRQDNFSFATDHRPHLKPYFDGSERPTKRLVLSCVMGFFDPLGLLAPFTIHGKMLIQDLWRAGCSWDEEVDAESLQKWERWTSLLSQVENVRIPRCYLGDHHSSNIDSLQLHIFMDASEQAYGCVAYLRVVVNERVTCRLIMSRNKVAPLKRQSVPRLELMAAVLGSRLSCTAKANHSLPIGKQFLWTDSQTVLSWIRSDQFKFKQFVAFRIGEIRENTNVSDWRWVPTKLNIADVLTKWGQGPPLESNSPWFKGPDFLLEPETRWPIRTLPDVDTEEEMRACLLYHDTVHSFSVVNVDSTYRWVRLLRITASVLRFIANCRRKKAGQPIVVSMASPAQERLLKAKPKFYQQPLQQDELHAAETILWRQAQHDVFPEEVRTLERNRDRKPEQTPDRIVKTSPVYKLCPILDTENVMRVGGRLQYADCASFDVKHPVILPKNHAVTDKLILFYHEKLGHGNRETVFNELRQRFHIPKLRSAIAKVAKCCMWCRVNRCQPQVPMMAPLPVQRVTPRLRPFSSVGVDYLGPVEVSVGRRCEKRWVALFTCLVVRAVHLEVVHSLTTQSCQMAIRRFMTDRGVPDEIFSDNGTNFKGAKNEWEKMQRVEYECAETVTSPTMKWNFIPPGTPHMGGIWERMVRSVKEILRTLEDGRKLTDEVLLTSLSEAKDMINSRPLVYLPQDSEKSEAITPNHFLRGAVKGADLVVDGSTDFAEALRNAYKQSQHLADKMWERWVKEYLPTLNKRPKWIEDRKQMEVGDLVFIVDGKHRKQWIRGIVEQVCLSGDGRIRQVEVRTAKGVFKRAVANLAVIEISGKSGTSGDGPEPKLRAGVC
ncbi:uncharacterized protein LOC128735940 [Sabethes cyaneus]|uniref:uncharacterized protein LOC128735940 n=1 Tax=Sabethes cyaneus TaxID=53552 RepID=UPI00237E26C9|nr:uncharacterized protein LOC128735940 [Sabethes cyaneus]